MATLPVDRADTADQKPSTQDHRENEPTTATDGSGKSNHWLNTKVSKKE